MKSLYESILDNDDVLFGDVKKSVNNIFTYILLSKQENIPYMEFMDKINDTYLDDIVDCFPSLKKSGFEFEFNSERNVYNNGKRIIWLYAKNYTANKRYVNNVIFYITLRDDDKMCLNFNRHWDFGAKLKNRIDQKKYDKDRSDFFKKNNFTQINFYDSFKQM